MTVTDLFPVEEEIDLSILAEGVDDFLDAVSERDLATWAEHRRQFVNEDFHREWYDLVERESRLCIVAPRDHAKSECITINQAVWRCTHNPGFWVYVFAATRPQAEKLMARIKGAMRETSPYLLYNAISDNKWDVTFSNEARVTVGGIGQSVRTVHPDLIIGDDVLGEKNSLTYLQRKRVERYWLGDVSGMCHPGTIRAMRDGERIEFAPTKIHLVGTPFHGSDLLMGLKTNPIYRWRRYAAEFNPDALAPGTCAVETN